MIRLIENSLAEKQSLTHRVSFHRPTPELQEERFGLMVQTHRSTENRASQIYQQSIMKETEPRASLSVKKIKRREVEPKLPSIPGRTKRNEEENLSPTKGISEGGTTVNEIKRILDESAKRNRVENKSSDAPKNILVDDDYESVGPSQNKEDDKEDVKALDRWRLEVKRRTLLSSIDKRFEKTDMYKKKKTTENFNIPLVNTDALNKILVDSDNENDDKNPDYFRGMSAAANSRNKEDILNKESEKLHKGIEGSMYENNRWLLNALVMRKVNRQLKVEDVKKLTNHQLKLQIKIISESVLTKFKALKKYISEIFVQNQVEKILRKLKNEPVKSEVLVMDPDEGDREGTPPHPEKEAIDYRMVELALTKNYEHAIQECQNLTSRITTLNHENFQLNRELTQIQHQLQQLNEKYKDVDGYSSPQTLSPVDRQRRFGFKEDVSRANDLTQIQKARYEKKKQEAIINEKFRQIQQKLNSVLRETESSQQSLKRAKDSKEYYKMQLKDLYYQLLKDENHLMESKSDASYTWVIRALEKINEEVKEQAFPAFMDRHCVKFILEYSKAQSEVEKYCRQQKLFSLISNIDDFKQMNMLNQNQSPGKANVRKNQDISPVALPPGFLGVRPKSPNSLLEDFQSRIHAMKRSNVKAKRLVNMVQYNSKGRSVIAKWEDVDPFMSTDEMIRPQGSVEIEAESPKQQSSMTKTKFSKSDFSTIEGNNPSEAVNKMLANLELMKKNEINRIIRDHLGFTLDERVTSILEKTFRFMFGKSEGTEAFRRFIKEKQNFEEKNMKTHQTHKKSQSQSQSRYQGTKHPLSFLAVQVGKSEEEFNNEASQKSERLSPFPSITKSVCGSSLLKVGNSPLPWDKVAKQQYASISSKTIPGKLTHR